MFGNNVKFVNAAVDSPNSKGGTMNVLLFSFSLSSEVLWMLYWYFNSNLFTHFLACECRARAAGTCRRTFLVKRNVRRGKMEREGHVASIFPRLVPTFIKSKGRFFFMIQNDEKVNETYQNPMPIRGASVTWRSNQSYQQPQKCSKSKYPNNEYTRKPFCKYILKVKL